MSNEPELDDLGLEAAADSLTPMGRAARWPQEYVEEQAAFVVAAYLRAAGEGLAERLEGPEPLTDDEIRLCLEGLSLRAYRMSPVGLIDSARAKLRARLAREDADDGV